jgi:hypothetical protein
MTDVELPEEESEVVIPVLVEWVNEPPHGTELHSMRLLSVEDVKQGWGLTIDQDLRWTKENGFRLPVAGNEDSLTPEVLAWLAKDPKFVIHYETHRD